MASSKKVMLFIFLDDSGDLHPHSGEPYLVYGGFATEKRKYLEKCVKLVMQKGIATPELRYNKVDDKFKKLLFNCLDKRKHAKYFAIYIDIEKLRKNAKYMKISGNEWKNLNLSTRAYMMFLLIKKYAGEKTVAYIDRYYSESDSNFICNLVLNICIDNNLDVKIKFAHSHEIKGLQIADFVAGGFRTQLTGKEYFLGMIKDSFEKSVEESQHVEKFIRDMIDIML